MKGIEHTFLWILLLPCVCFGFCFEDAGREYAINPVLLKTLAKVESNLNPNAVNRNADGSIDIGLMQINSTWTARLSYRAEDLLSDPCANVMAGAWVLRHCLDTYGYTWQAVGCYNAKSSGKRIDYAWKVFRQLRQGRGSSMLKPVDPSSNASGSTLVFRLHENTMPGEDKGQ